MRLRAAIAALVLVACDEGGAFPTGRDRACEGLAAGVRCTPEAVLTCGPGEIVRDRTTCAQGERCFDGFGCGACAAGTMDCGEDGETPRVCEANHRWRVGASCDLSQVCERGRCVPACDPSPDARESRGCEFWAAQTLHRGLPSATRDALPFSVVTANPWRRAVQFGVDGVGVRDPVRVIAARGVYTVAQPWLPDLVDGAERSVIARGAALRVRTNHRVAAYQYSPLASRRPAPCEGEACAAGSGDGSLLLPTSALGRFYLVATRPASRERSADGTWRAHPAFITVIGTVDGTRVTVISRGRIAASRDGAIPATGPGGRVALTLGAGDVLQLVTETAASCPGETRRARDGATLCAPVEGDELTGTRIEASAPVAAFAGHDCARVPEDGAACDHLVEQLPPLDTLGPEYVLAPTAGALWVRVVAGYDDTTLRLSPAGSFAPRSLRAGEFVDLPLDASVELIASRPVLVASFSSRASGDASMAFEVPIALWRNTSEVYAPFGFETTLDLSASLGSGVRVDDNPVALAADTRVPGRAIWRVALAPGMHAVSGLGPMDLVGVRVLSEAPGLSLLLRGGGDLRALPVPE